MRYVIVNLDKQQYFRPVELGGSHGSPYRGVAEDQGPQDYSWQTFLSYLLELRPESPDRRAFIGHLYGAWAGGRVALVRGDENSGALLCETDQALKALGADVPDYKYVRENYADLTNDLRKAWPKLGWVQQARYATLTLPDSYGWLTEQDARAKLESAKGGGKDFYRGYLSWLEARKDLRSEVSALVKEEIARLGQQGGGSAA